MIYKSVESTEKPLEVEENGNTVYLRKNITTKVVSNDDVETTYYVYDEAEMTKEDYDEYTKALSITNESNIATIMEAIADLYVAMVSE